MILLAVGEEQLQRYWLAILSHMFKLFSFSFSQEVIYVPHSAATFSLLSSPL